MTRTSNPSRFSQSIVLRTPSVRTGINYSSEQSIQSTHVPFVFDAPRGSFANGRLRAHIAKQNLQVNAILEAILEALPDEAPTDVAIAAEDDVLVMFTASTNAYVRPKYYTGAELVLGKIVSTWNYAAVQVYGKLKLYYDSKAPVAREVLLKQIRDLSNHSQSKIKGSNVDGENPKPWVVEDAPEKYIDIMMRNIVGIQIEISSIQGKFKMSWELGTVVVRGCGQGLCGSGKWN
ncbi:putative FMN-binding domain-containing protein [Aspergillus filifer]